MEIKKTVDLETLDQEQKDAIEAGTLTEEQLLEEHEETLKTQETEQEGKLKKAEEVAHNYKIRAEKAEDKKGKEEVVTPQADLSQSDLYALMRNDVPEEDVSEVTDYAKLKKVSVSEALKTPFVKSLLESSQEERTTAKASNTKKSARGTGKVDGNKLLEKAQSDGSLPESSEDMAKLVEARLGIKK